MLRVAVDANVLIAGIVWPRWPYEVLQHAVRGDYKLVLSELVIEEAYARFQEDFQEFLAEFDLILKLIPFERVPSPSLAEIRENLDLMRDHDDIPIAISLMKANVDYFVTYDRDYTAPDRSTERIREAMPNIMLPLFSCATLWGGQVSSWSKYVDAIGLLLRI